MLTVLTEIETAMCTQRTNLLLSRSIVAGNGTKEQDWDVQKERKRAGSVDDAGGLGSTGGTPIT
jgi:hypothetical protein